jgi:hypothetical protein
VLRFELRGRELQPLLEAGSSSGLVVSGWNGSWLAPERSYSVALSEWLATTDRIALPRARARRAARVGTEAEALARWLERAL